MKLLLVLTLLNVSLISAQAEVTKDNFGTTRDGESVERYTLKNKHGFVAKIITLGGIVTELHVPDRAGKLADIALGFDNVAEYEEHNGTVYFGCITGRVADRIAGGKFDLDGKSYRLDLHPKTSFHLHGGLKGFSKVIWKAEVVTDQPGIQLYTATYTTPLKGKSGKSYDCFHGFCLEPQHHPDSVHHAEFPATILHPGETYRIVTVHQFSRR